MDVLRKAIFKFFTTNKLFSYLTVWKLYIHLYYQVNSLDSGLNYCFRVSAVNKAGIGYHSQASDVHKASNPLHTPSQPLAPKVTHVDAASVALEWAPPKSAGGCELLGYEIEYQHEVWRGFAYLQLRVFVRFIFKVDVDWKKLLFGDELFVSNTNTVARDLNTGSKYHFRVSAVNVIGTGPPSMPSRHVLVKDMIGIFLLLLM